MKLFTAIAPLCLLGISAHAQLLHRYDFETEDSANDTVGTAHGTIFGSAIVVNGALNTLGGPGGLSGGIPQNSVRLPASAVAGITNAFSIEIWYVANTNGPWCTAFSFSDNTTANYVLATPAAGNSPFPSRVAVKGAGGSAAEQLANQTYCDTGVLHNMIVTYDGTRVTYYLDGALPTFSGLQNSFNDSGLNLSSLTYIGIAGGAPYGDNTINGKVYDFRIYGQALTAPKVAAIYGLGTNASNAAIAAALGSPTAFTWNGGGADDNWSAALNWVQAMAPGTVNSSLVFAGGTRTTPNMETNYSVTGLVFSNSASSFTLGTANGSTLTLAGGVTNNSANPQTLNLPISLSGPATLHAASGSLVLNSNITLGVSGLTLAGNNNFTLNQNVSGSGSFVKAGAGTLTVAGGSLSAVTVNFNNGTTVINGAVSSTSSGPAFIGNTSGNAVVDLQSGTFSVTGELKVGGLGAGGSGTFNLNGGTLTVPQISAASASGSSVFNFNGGTLRPATNSSSFLQGLTGAYVHPGGAIIDTAGRNITISQRLLNGGGGLTKIGNGTLTLSGGYNYTGPTIVTAGTLSLNAAQASSGSDLRVTNATLNLSLNNSNSSITAGSMVFAGNTTNKLDYSISNPDFGAAMVPTVPAMIASGVLVSGTNVININGPALAQGQYPLIYTGSPIPTNNFQLGTLPPGVVAVLTNSGTSLDLLITESGLGAALAKAAHWTFDEGFGMTAYDISGNNRTATLMGSAGWAGQPIPVGAYGLNLGYAQASGPAVNTLNSFTACAWVKLNVVNAWQTILSIDGNSVSGFYLQLQNNGRFGFRRLGSDSPGAPVYFAEAPATASAGLWYHVAGVYDSTNNQLLLYTNGALAATASFSTPWQAGGNTAIGRGRYLGGNVDLVNGQIDDARLYQSALPAANIQALYAMGLAPQFTLTPSPRSMIVPRSGSATSAISIGKLNGFSDAVNLFATNLPAGITASFSPQPAANASVMTLTADNSATLGHYNFTVVGFSGSAECTLPMLLMVTSNSTVANLTWPAYSPNLNYNFTNEFVPIPPPTNILNDCAGVTTTITLPSNWFCFRFGATKNALVTSNAWIPMLQKLNTDFIYFRDVMGWPPDKRAKRGYFSAVYLLGSGTCVGGTPDQTGGWQGNINYMGENWPMGLFSYYPVYSFDPACPYGDRVFQMEACTHEMIHSVLADMPGCKQACWFQEGGNTWLQGTANAQKTGNYNSMGYLSAGSVIAPFMPIECYSGWLQDDSFGGPCAEGVNMFNGNQQICTWRNLLGGVQYSEAFPHFMGEVVSQGSVAWVWRYATNRVLEGLGSAPGGLGDGQTRRLIMEYRARAAMCDYGKWSNAYTALLNNNWGANIDQEWAPYWIDCPAWTARCYVVTTNNNGTLTPERRTLPGWSGANQVPLQVVGSVGTTANVTFTPLGNNMTCQLVYRAADNSVVYGQPVSGGTCGVRFDKAPKNNVAVAVICNTDWLYLGETSRLTKYDYRLTLGPGVVGPANIATRWYTPATTTKTTYTVRISYSLNGSSLALSWPASHTGWRLQSQTNGLSPNNWFDIPGATATNLVSIPVNQNHTSVFYRLAAP